MAHCYTISFSSAIEWIIIALSFDVQLITFCLDYFFNPEFFLTGALQLFFMECFDNFFTVGITNNVCPRHSTFYFLDKKTLDKFGTYPFAKIFLYFDFLTLSPTLNWGSLSLCSTPYSIYMPGLISLVLFFIFFFYFLVGFIVVVNYFI